MTVVVVCLATLFGGKRWPWTIWAAVTFDTVVNLPTSIDNAERLWGWLALSAR